MPVLQTQAAPEPAPDPLDESTIQEHILELLSEKIIAGEVRPGQKVRVDRQGSSLVMRSLGDNGEGERFAPGEMDAAREGSVRRTGESLIVQD